MTRNQFNLLVLCLFATTVGSGCGRSGDRTSLLPRVNVSEIMSDENPGLTNDAQTEQYVNNQIDAELRKKRSQMSQASETVLTSAEKKVDRWKNVLPGGKRRDKAKSDGEFGRDPFLDTIDEIIAKDAQGARDAAKSARQNIASSVDQALDQIADNTGGGDMFADLPDRADETMQSVANMARETANGFAEVTPGTKADVFGPQAGDVFGSEPQDMGEGFEVAQNGLEQVSRASAGRRSIAERTGATVHRFDELFDEDAAVQQVAGETTKAVRDVVDAARFETKPVVEKVTERLEHAATDAFAEFNNVVPEHVATTDPVDDTMANMFDPPADERASELPQIPDLPGLPGLEMAAVNPVAEQKDAVVTANTPRVLPDLAPEPPAIPELPENAFAENTRVEVDTNDPVFSDPVLPDIDEIPEVAIPDLNHEPAPRFTASADSRPVLTTRAASVTPPRELAAPMTNAAPAAASVLPDVDWQGRREAQPKNFRAPSEWTAWFLMGGAALVVLLLFAPNRRQN